jgi:hypothetical protein
MKYLKCFEDNSEDFGLFGKMDDEISELTQNFNREVSKIREGYKELLDECMYDMSDDYDTKYEIGSYDWYYIFNIPMDELDIIEIKKKIVSCVSRLRSIGISSIKFSVGARYSGSGSSGSTMLDTETIGTCIDNIKHYVELNKSVEKITKIKIIFKIY